MRIWTCRDSKIEDARKISNTLDINLIVAELLVQRGMAGAREAAAFLCPTLLDMHNPYLFKDMGKALKRLAKAHAEGEKVLVYGDYDVDGVTSTTLLFKVLTDLGFAAVAYIPHRQEEGYGLHKEVIDKAFSAGVKVIITVDCGISALEEIAYAAQKEIDIIVTDHHEPPSVLPSALAIINPKVKDSGYPFKDLAGVGVTFKLAQALIAELGSEEVRVEAEKEVLDLVALGTIADVVPLIGENRIIVAYGLRQMEHTVHPGLRALLNECGLSGKIKATQVAFIVAPRINAAGRLDSAKIGIELLLSSDLEKARMLARDLSRENILRQEVEKKILEEAIILLEGQPLPKVIVLAAQGWHHGVIGIVASRLVERFHRPTFLIALDGGEGKGSARGISGYHVLEELTACQELLTKFGGHRQAAGFSLPAINIEGLRDRLNLNAQKLDEEIFYPQVKIDRLVTLDGISEDLMKDLESLAPFGFGNSAPVLGGRGIPLNQAFEIGKDGSHLKVRLGRQGEWEGIAFRQGAKALSLKDVDQVDLAFALEWNSYQGQRELQLHIKEIEPEASWKDHEIKLSLAEVAIAEETPSFTWIDWREKQRVEWIKSLLEEQTTRMDMAMDHIWVWDTDMGQDLISLTDFLTAQSYDAVPSLVTPSSTGNNDILWGIVVGVPLGSDHLRRGLSQFVRLGVTHLIWVEGWSDETLLRLRCGHFTRDELIQVYRRLTTQAQEQNPFIWKVSSEENTFDREALKIFEELGLFTCHGGVRQLVLEYHPTDKKLDLDSSLRYRTGQKLWGQMKAFRNKLESIPLGKLNDIMNDRIEKGGTYDGF